MTCSSFGALPRQSTVSLQRCYRSHRIFHASNRSDQQQSALMTGEPLFRFGIISDIQYADIPDGLSFTKVPRYYRAALHSLTRAVSGWKKEQVDFAMHFGDIVDGFNPREESPQALDTLVREFDRLGKPHWHMIGNHCLYNFPRDVLNERLRMGEPGAASHYQWSPHALWRIIVLDAYDVSQHGWAPEHPLHQQALQILAENNQHENKGRPPDVEGPGQRFCHFNGGVSQKQLQWLQHSLAEARAAEQRVIVCCHVPLFPGTCSDKVLLWNYEEVLDILQSSGNVFATFCGHAHQDGYRQDATGIHHRVLNGVIETPPDVDCHGYIDVFRDELNIVGFGDLDSMLMRTSQGQIH